MQNVLSKHEKFEKFGAGETSKQGLAVKTISCQANMLVSFARPLYRVMQVLHKVWKLVRNRPERIRWHVFEKKPGEFHVGVI